MLLIIMSYSSNKTVTSLWYRKKCKICGW